MQPLDDVEMIPFVVTSEQFLEHERVSIDGKLSHHESLTSQLKDQMNEFKQSWAVLTEDMKNTKVSRAAAHPSHLTSLHPLHMCMQHGTTLCTFDVLVCA